MKLYAGTLEEEIEASPAGLPLPRMLDASAQIARAIAELAAVHIVIQDLKPSNLLVNDVAAAGVPTHGARHRAASRGIRCSAAAYCIPHDPYDPRPTAGAEKRRLGAFPTTHTTPAPTHPP